MNSIIFYCITRNMTSSASTIGAGEFDVAHTTGPVVSRDAHFTFPLGEMTLTLEDVALLFALPCGGDTMGACDIPESWCEKV
jgi:hypothetical protein